MEASKPSEPDDPGPEQHQPQPPKPAEPGPEQHQHELINIVECEGWWFRLKHPPPGAPDPPDARVGSLRRIKSSIKATCNRHKNCSLHVAYNNDVPGDDEKVARALAKWLDRGVPMQREGHQKDAYHVKVNEFNMKPRTKTAKAA